MAGVIDQHGQQWEHCCQCGTSVKFQELQYARVKPTLEPRWPDYGHHTKLDLCSACSHPEDIRPSKLGR